MRAFIFISLILLTSGSGAFAADKAAQERALGAITKLGGTITYDSEAAGKNVIGVDLNNSAIADGDLRHLLAFSKLQTLILRGTKIGDGSTQYIGFMKNLRVLNMFQTGLTDKGLERLKNLNKLETLLIGGTNVTDDGLKHVRKFSHLKKMSVFQTAVSDLGLKHLEKLGSLEVLLIGESKVSDEGAKSIQKILPKLRFNEDLT